MITPRIKYAPPQGAQASQHAQNFNTPLLLREHASPRINPSRDNTPTPQKMKISVHTQQCNDEEGAQLKEMPKTLHTCQRKIRPLLPKLKIEVLPSMNPFESRSPYLQMKSQNGFSNLTARADGSTAESDLS